MNKLTAKTTILCNTCGDAMKRRKTIKVNAGDKENAKTEADAKFHAWAASLKGTNCKVCDSILKGV